MRLEKYRSTLEWKQWKQYYSGINKEVNRRSDLTKKLIGGVSYPFVEEILWKT